MSDDEYDAYNVSLDIEDLGPYIISLPPSPPTTVNTGQPSQEEEPQEPHQEELQEPQSSDADVYYTAPSTQIDAHHSDSYSDYDLSEFTADDFASIDAAVVSVGESSTSALKRAGAAPASTHNGGPAVSMVLEGVSKTLKSMSLPAPPHPLDTVKFAETARQKTREPSPFDRFRAYRGILSVTDLTSPSWCEVQFDYGLRQKRFKKIKERPTEFKTATGKTILVDQSVAVVNERITQRGRSVHKVLERELHPEVVEVKTTSEEERWALRLINMIASMQSLLQVGRCREMNVFGVLNSQVITGIVDEVERRSVTLPPPSPRSNLKRSPSKSSAPTTPAKRQSKRARRSPSPTQLPLTSFFPSSISRTESHADASSSPLLEDKCIQVSSPPHTSGLVLTLAPTRPPPLPDPQFKLHLSDTKTRRVPTIPAHDDTFSARMQLMLYHRLLSSLLVSPTESEEALDFQNLWTRVRVDHRRPFSKAFRDSAGLMFDSKSLSLNCLDDLTDAWRGTVEMLNISGVDDTLTVVYRTQPVEKMKKTNRNQEHKPVDQLISEEANDIVSAVIASLDGDVTPSCSEETMKGSLKTPLLDAASAVGLASDAVPDSADESLQWAIQQSLLEQVRRRSDLKGAVLDGGADSDSASPPETAAAGGGAGDEDTPDDAAASPDAPSESTVIGTKVFQMHGLALNGYLKSVLDWWYGRRPPKGVDLHLTKRCLSCEYQEGCEWRETKAAEWRRSKGHH